jgi:hypothetical protein
VRLPAPAPALAALAALALTGSLTGCQTSAEKSARLEREAKLHPAAKTAPGLSIARTSRDVKVVTATVLSGSEGDAAVVTLANTSPHALANVPLQITVHDGAGATVYTNTTPGLGHTLTSVPLLEPHGRLVWVDDQVQASQNAATGVAARAGEVAAVAGAVPHISAHGVKLYEDQVNGVGAEGEVVNSSSVTQKELVIYAVATKGGRVVAAGRAILPQAPPGATHFQVFFVGDPKGASLHVSAPATTLH